MAATLDDLRQFYADEVRVIANLKSPSLVRALATVDRERYLGPGPWRIQLFDWSMMGTGGAHQYLETPDADPRHVYHNVAIAIDPARMLNNGQPGTLAAWIDQLDVTSGSRVLHVGCGTGYYTAILAEMASASGRVLAFEVDTGLAARARENLAHYAHVDVIAGDAREILEGVRRDMINARHAPQRSWSDARRIADACSCRSLRARPGTRARRRVPSRPPRRSLRQDLRRSFVFVRGADPALNTRSSRR
jgi:protein-L-isoaspartate(D-aspartate) O-methyltransferase